MVLPSWVTNQSFSSDIYPNLSCGWVWLKSTCANTEKKQQYIISVLFRRLISLLSLSGPRIEQGSLKKYRVAVGLWLFHYRMPTPQHYLHPLTIHLPSQPVAAQRSTQSMVVSHPALPNPRTSVSTSIYFFSHLHSKNTNQHPLS